MQEMNPDTVLEQAAPAADPEPQAIRPAEDTSIPSALEAPAAEADAPQPEAPAEPAPVTVVDIRFRNNAKSYFFDPNGLTLAVGDHVIIDTARGDEFGICAAGNHAVRPRELVLPLRKVLRAATAQDERINAENQEKEKKAFDVCQQKILSHKLDMQLVSAECAFDGSKILFFFTAEGRVDFRELVKDLASAFRTRIELRQIGVRDKRTRRVRPSVLLQGIPRRFPARLHQDGQDPEPESEPHQDLRHLRAAHVLPQVRAGSL